MICTMIIVTKTSQYIVSAALNFEKYIHVVMNVVNENNTCNYDWVHILPVMQKHVMLEELRSQYYLLKL